MPPRTRAAGDPIVEPDPADTTATDGVDVDDVVEPAASDDQGDALDARALALSKHIQAAAGAHGDDVVDAALDHAAKARKAAGVDRGAVPQGRSAADVKTSR